MSGDGASVDAPDPEPDDVDDLIDPRRLIMLTLGVVIVLFGVIALIAWHFQEPLVLISRSFVSRLGGWGIALGFFLPDAFTVPLPNDTFGLFGLAGGMNFWEVTAWATAGSVAGGCVGWGVGRQLRQTRVIGHFMDGRGRKLEALIRRNGVWVVAVAAITPLPYSLAAWAAGAVRMPFVPFALTSLSRVIRVVISLYAIHLGLLTAT